MLLHVLRHVLLGHVDWDLDAPRLHLPRIGAGSIEH